MRLGGALAVSFLLLLATLTAVDALSLRMPEPGEVVVTEYMRLRSVATGAPAAARWTPLTGMSGAIVCAVLKAEDHLFFRHRAFNWSQLEKAARLALSGTGSMGGSTITQQLARNLFLSPERSIWRKLREAALAVALEVRFSKLELLAYYLNVIEWGDGIWGAAGAAQAYLGKSPDAVELEEALLLASLIAAPRTAPASQLDRMGKVYERVNHQFLVARLTTMKRWREASGSWGEIRAALSSGKPLEKAASRLSMKAPAGIPIQAVGTECGLQSEIANHQRFQNMSGQATAPGDPSRTAIERTLLTPSLFPVRLSHDRTKLLLKEFERETFSLLVRDATTSEVLHRDDSMETQLSPAFNPSGDALVFTEFDPSTRAYFLYLADIGRLGRSRLPAPPSRSAPPIIWSPTGASLAYARVDPRTLRRQLHVLSIRDGIRLAPLAAPMSSTGGFAWHPDGDRLATIDFERPGNVTIWSVAGVRLAAFTVSDGQCRSVHWQGDPDEILVACRDVQSEYFVLYSVRPDDGSVTLKAKADGDISGPSRLPKGQGFTYHVTYRGDTVPWIADEAGPRRLGAFEGSALIASMDRRTATASVIHTGRLLPPRLVDVAFATGLESRVVFESGPRAKPELEAEAVSIPVNGLEVPGFLWKTPQPPPERAGIVLVHGGPEAFVAPVWGPNKVLIAEHGVDLLAVNFRGSTGYGHRFEASGKVAEQVEDVGAAVAFLEKTRGIPRSKILLFAHSYGAMVVAEALHGTPDLAGAAALLGLAGVPRLMPPRPFPGRLIVFHGTADIAQTSAQARAALAGILPPADRLLWRDVVGEGHTFHRNASLAEVHAAIFAALGR